MPLARWAAAVAHEPRAQLPSCRSKGAGHMCKPTIGCKSTGTVPREGEPNEQAREAGPPSEQRR